MSLSFQPNERVLCYHGPLIYEAKVLKVENWTEQNTRTGELGPHFFVHYKGWKQTWDEWVSEKRLLKYDEKGLAKQKEASAQEAYKTASSASTSKNQKTGTGKDSGRLSLGGFGRKEGTRGTKRGREDDDGTRKPELKLIVPDILKVQLVDDWEAVTKNNTLVALPRDPTVEELLNDFKDYVLQLQKPPHKAQSLLPTIVSGLQLYFNRALGQNLLYRFERPQYAEQRKKYITGSHVVVGTEKEMSELYGAEHFLRMLVSLPAMVANSTMDQESVNILREYVQLLFDFMVKERHRVFQQVYETTSNHYQNLARS